MLVEDLALIQLLAIPADPWCCCATESCLVALITVMKRVVIVRCSGVVLALSVLCMALSSYAQESTIQYHTNFPRLGMIYIGGDQTYPVANWPIMAKFNVVVMGGDWERWGDNRAWTREDVVTGVHAASKIGTKVFQYVDFESINVQPASDIYPTYTATVQANNWFLYQTGTSGTVVMSPNNASYSILNQTHWSPRDPNTGFYPFEAAAKYSYDMFIAGTAAHPRNAAPDMDGLWTISGMLRTRMATGNAMARRRPGLTLP